MTELEARMTPLADDEMLPLADDVPPLADDVALRAWLEQVTVRKPPPLVPELSLYQADVLEDLWEHLEALTGRKQEPPYWAFLWPGGLAVARYLLDHPALAAGRRVLDVATGNGVIALAAALAGAQVTANDIDLLALRAVQLHAGMHGLEVEILPGDLLGRDPADLPFELITVGDAFYEASLAVRLEPWLHAARRAGIEVLMGDPGRNFLPDRGLIPVTEYAIPTLREIEGRTQRTGRVYRIDPPSP